MARKGNGFNVRFPYFGIFLVIAVVIAIPLTVWSLNHIPTNLKQEAQAPNCGPKNQNPPCPSGYTCSYISKNPLLGGTCVLSSLRPPTNLTSSATCKYNFNSPNELTISFKWNASANANQYIIYGSYYYVNQGKLTNVKLNPYTVSSTSYTLKLPIPHGVKLVYWHVKAANSFFKVFSPSSSSSTATFICSWF